MCDCKDIKMGSYDNVTTLQAPKWSSKQTIDVDTCIVSEIQDLWKNGIITYGCCCGHNKTESMVNVDLDYIDQMSAMDYVQNHPDKTRKDTFKLKSC